MDAPEVVVEVHLANGLPSFTIVGLPEAEVKESKDHVRAAISTAQFEFPSRRVTVNLAPADLPKGSGRYDLPIALGILAASGQLPKEALKNYEIAGELALTGELRPIRGALAMTYHMVHANEVMNMNAPNKRAFILPNLSAQEASLLKDAIIYPANSLLEVCAHLTCKTALNQYQPNAEVFSANYPDFNEVKGQTQAKRALEIAAAGGHSVLMSDPLGTGKVCLQRVLQAFCPA